jgi:hypothetical protein
MEVKSSTLQVIRSVYGKIQPTRYMNNYVITVWDGDTLVHNAKAKAKSPELAKSKALNDCWKLDKMMGTERDWYKYRWDIQPTISR